MQDPKYYHIYNRGVDRRLIFCDEIDYDYFLYLLARFFGPAKEQNEHGYTYKNYHNAVQLLSFCLMPNHFHLFVRLEDEQLLGRLIQGIKIAYVMYFNRRYSRTGILFETKYRSKLIETDPYLLHISRYIHMNAVAVSKNYQFYRYSSLRFYVTGRQPVWLETSIIKQLFSNIDTYLDFHKSYELELASKALMLEKI